MSLVIIAGRLGKDAEVETTSGGTKILKFTVVENEYRNGEEVSTWYDVKSFSPFMIDKQIKALKKGTFIVASADLTIRPGFSKNGKLFLNYDALVNSVRIINVNSGKKSDEDETTEETEVSTGMPQVEEHAEEAPKQESVKKTKKTEPVVQQQVVDDEGDNDEELPF